MDFSRNVRIGVMVLMAAVSLCSPATQAMALLRSASLVSESATKTTDWIQIQLFVCSKNNR